MKTKLYFIALIACGIFVLDHLTKWGVVANLPLGGEITIIPNIFDIVHTRNTGAAFGMLSDWDSPLRDYFFYGVAVVAFIFLYHYVKSTPSEDKISLAALALITGGAIGNITDRFMRGSVVDFLSVHYHHEVREILLFSKRIIIPLTWPAFNVADAAICVGVTLLLIQGLRLPQPQIK